MRPKMDFIHWYITTLHFQVFLNPPNSSVWGGGGVDGAIHRAAGPQ
ncbi:macro domain-containing protein, partial [Enterobacter hormaechei]